MIKNSHDKLPTFGIGKDMSKEQWNFYINQLIDLGLINLKYDGYIKTMYLDQMAIDFIQSGIPLDLVEYVDIKPIKPTKVKLLKDQNLNPLQSEIKIKNESRCGSWSCPHPDSGVTSVELIT